jgi:hypothetical protein
MLLQLLQLPLSMKLIAPKDAHTVSQSVRFKFTNKAASVSQLWLFLYSPTGLFLPQVTSKIMVGFNRGGRNAVHSENPLLTLFFPFS